MWRNAMKFDYAMVYVTDVAASLAFFECAFGVTTRSPACW